MECYDISDIRGTSAVGSMAVFENGQPKTSHYRRFRIRTVATADDYAMIKEVLRRRFKTPTAPSPIPESPEKPLEAIPETFGAIPDLVLIDGGKGQLHAAQKAMQERGVDFIPTASPSIITVAGPYSPCFAIPRVGA